MAEAGQGVFMPVPAPAAFGIPADHPATDWVARRLTPHPVGTYESPLKLDHPVGNGRPRTYVACTNPLHRSVEEARRWVKAQGRPLAFSRADDCGPHRRREATTIVICPVMQPTGPLCFPSGAG